jgi:hypothetical protein
MTAQSNLFLAAAIGFLAVSPALADDMVKEERTGRVPGVLGSLRGLGSANELFMSSRGDLAQGAMTPGSPPPPKGNSTFAATALASNTLARAGDTQPSGPATVPRAPTGATALMIDGAARGGTNLYGIMRDPRATIVTPAGLRLADPMLIQSIKASGQNEALRKLPGLTK